MLVVRNGERAVQPYHAAAGVGAVAVAGAVGRHLAIGAVREVQNQLVRAVVNGANEGVRQIGRWIGDQARQIGTRRSRSSVRDAAMWREDRIRDMVGNKRYKETVEEIATPLEWGIARIKEMPKRGGRRRFWSFRKIYGRKKIKRFRR